MGSGLLNSEAASLEGVSMSAERRVALITGCGKREGIGATIARTLSAAGMTIVAADSEPAGVRDVNEPARALDPEWGGVTSLVKEIEGNGGTASAVTGDISSESGVSKIIGHAAGAHGRLDVLVNNAGAPFSLGHGDIETINVEEWDRVMAINLRGTFLMCKAAVPHMRRRKWGRIINISTVAARMGSKANSSYAASKAGILGLTNSLALDLGPDGITSNAVLPGFILTTRSLSGMSKKLGKSEIDDETIAKSVPPTPISRAGSPADVAAVVGFLASDAASFITGQAYTVDGGGLRF
jgi:3-oxoacyl-[acyl-carrier protein] reductase